MQTNFEKEWKSYVGKNIFQLKIVNLTIVCIVLMFLLSFYIKYTIFQHSTEGTHFAHRKIFTKWQIPGDLKNVREA